MLLPAERAVVFSPRVSTRGTSRLLCAWVFLGAVALAPAREVSAQDVLSIAEAVRDLDNDGSPEREGQIVSVEGRLTGVPILLGSSLTSSLISAEAAVLVVAVDSTLLRGFAGGDRVRATGTLRQLFGQEQIHLSSIELLSKGTGNLRAVHVNLADVEDEYWSGQRVHVSGELQIDRRAGFIQARLHEGAVDVPVVIPVSLLSNTDDVERLVNSAGRQVGITGTLLQNTGDAGGGAGYYLLPLSPADLDLPPVRHSREIGAALAFIVLLTVSIYLWYQRRRWKLHAAALAQLAERLTDSERALRKSELEYRSLFEDVPIGIYRVAPDGRILASNQALLRILGIREEKLPDYRITDIYLDSGEYERFEREISEREEIAGFESVWKGPSGATTIVRQNVRRVVGADGSLAYYEGTVEDLTDRRFAEEKLHETQGRMRQLLLANPSIIYSVSVTKKSAQVDWVSENVQRILGYSVSEALEPGWWPKAVHPDDHDRVMKDFAEFTSSSGQRPFTLEYRFRRQDGSYRWYRSDMRIISRHGDRIEIVAAALDVSEQKEASLALSAAEEHYRRLVTTSPYGIIALDGRGRITESNPAAAEILALDAHDMLGSPAARLVPPECRPAIRAEIERQMADPSLQADFETWVMQPNGGRKLIHIRSTPILQSNRSRGFHAVIRDLTAERARDAHFRLLGTALDNLGHGVAISDSDRKVIYANSEFKRILGYEGDDDQELQLDSFLPDEAAKEQLEDIKTALTLTGGWSGRKWRQRATDGRIIPIDAVIGLVPAPDGGGPHVLTIFTDASEKVEQEQHLRRAERLSSLGTLVGGVAHELNNPLNAIINFAALLLDEVEEGQVKDDLETIVREGQRAAKIVSSLRMISREADVKKPVKEAIDINDIVVHVLKLRSYSLSTSSITISSQLDRLVPLAWGDRSRIEQVLFNLVVNAEQAMTAHRGKGKLLVRTRTLGNRVVVEVTDDGPGISSEHMPHIFDPFWTTKAPGEGTGLGLSLVHNIVTEHDGKIYVRSTPGGGTTFQVELPVARGASAPSADMITTGAVGTLRILIVEDEPAVRKSLTRFLQREGHEVEEAADGRQALQKLEASEQFDVILSDLKMPGMGGHQLFNHLKEEGNGTERKMILMTGGVGGNELAQIDQGTPILLKPIAFSEVAAAIRRHIEIQEAALIGSGNLR